MRAAIIASFAWMLLAAPAFACRTVQSNADVIFLDLPADVSPNDLILEVEVRRLPQDFNTMRDLVVTAYVRRVVQGAYQGRRVRIFLEGNSCAAPFMFGQSGMVIGALREDVRGRLVLVPRWESVGEREARGGRFRQ